MASYRDPLAAALAELSVRQRHAAARLGEVGDAHRAILSQPLLAILDAAPAVIAATPTSLEGVGGVRRQLDAIENAIDRALAIDGPSRVASYAEGSLDGFGQWLNHVVAPWHGSVRQEGERRVAHARVDGVDVELEARVDGDEVHFALASKVPATLAISVTPQGRWRSFAKQVLFASEHEVLVPEVDDAFWIRGDDASVRAALTPSVTRALAYIRSFAPTLVIADGVARLEWILRDMKALNGAVFEGLDPTGPRAITESLVPRDMFVLHRELRFAVDPPPPPPPPARIDELREALRIHAADAVRYPLDGFLPDAVKRTLASIGPDDLEILDRLAASNDDVAPWAGDRARVVRAGRARPRIDEIRDALREYCADGVACRLDDMVCPEPDASSALGPADLALLDEIAASTGEEIAQEAASRAHVIRSEVAQKRVAAAESAAKLAELFAEDETTRAAVVARMARERDPAFLVALVTRVTAADSGAAFAKTVSESRSPSDTIIPVVKALVAHSGTAVIESMLKLPPPVSIETAVALLRFAPEHVALVRRMTVERRREVATAVASTGDMNAARRLFDDEDAEVRAMVVDRNVQFPSKAIAPELIEVLRRDPDARVRRAAAHALASVGAIASIGDDALAALHECSEDPDVREAAAQSIAAIRATRSSSYGERLSDGIVPLALLCPLQCLVLCDTSALPQLQTPKLARPMGIVSTRTGHRSTLVGTSPAALALRSLTEPVYVWRGSEREISLFSRRWSEEELLALPTIDPPAELVAKLADVDGARVEIPSGYFVLLAMAYAPGLPTETPTELAERAAALGHCRVGGPRDDPPTRADGVCLRVEPGTYQVAYASLLVDVEADVSIELYRLRPAPRPA